MANKFLEKSYWVDFNKKFMVKAHREEELHRALPKSLRLDRVLCIRTERTVRNDNTIGHNRKLYQLREAFPKESKVTVEERVDGSLLITHKEVRIKYKAIETRPEKAQEEKLKVRRSTAYIPSADHPWRRSPVEEKKLWQAIA